MIEKRNPKIYVICGKAKAGKDSVAKIINERKKNSTILSITFPLKEYAKIIDNWDGNEDSKPRDLLQTLGIQVIKNNIDPKFLIRRIKEDIEILSYYKDTIIISGIRLKEEIKEIKEAFDDVIVIKVIRPNYDNALTQNQKNHITENDLDDFKGDYDLINDKDYHSLENKVLDILKGE